MIPNKPEWGKDNDPQSEKALGGITESIYSRERLDPRPGDSLYIVLSDLRLAIDGVKSELPLTILDYGCGGSPYRTLFPSAEYRRADNLEMGDLDYVLKEGVRVQEKSDTFDMIISTQVIEHIDDPQFYLSECFRLLKSGGKLVLSTHGSFEDHPCPRDYRRWTLDGLRVEVRCAGFETVKIFRLTTGMRAVLFLFQRFWSSQALSSRSLLGALIKILAFLGKRLRRKLHRDCDKLFRSCRVVSEGEKGHQFYILLFVVATKP